MEIGRKEKLMLKLTPTDDKMICQLEKAKKTTKSGIILSNSGGTASKFAKIISVGPGKILDNGTRLSPQYKEGDRVYLTSVGPAYKDEEDDAVYYFVTDKDIIARVME